MRPLRWKNQYASTDRTTSQRHKRFLGCFNQLLEKAGQREHCHEMEQFLTELGEEVDSCLRLPDNTGDKTCPKFYPHLVSSLPLSPYGSNACHKCGLCDMAKAQIAEHLQQPVDCLLE